MGPEELLEHVVAHARAHEVEPDAVLATCAAACPRGPQHGVTDPAAVLRLDLHNEGLGGSEGPGSVRPNELQVEVHRQPLRTPLAHEGQAPVAHPQLGPEMLRELLPVGVLHAAPDEGCRRLVEGVLAVAGVVVEHAVLDGPTPAALELHLEEVEVAVDVAPTANLEASALALGVLAVGQQVVGVVVDRLVRERGLAADGQDVEVVTHRPHGFGKGGCGHDVLVLEPVEQRRPSVELGQSDAAPAGDVGCEGRGHERWRTRKRSATRDREPRPLRLRGDGTSRGSGAAERSRYRTSSSIESRT